jgi:ribosomal protein S18 acetylase RimI-like enzyme
MNEIRIEVFAPKYQPAFEKLNKEWIVKYFFLEDEDIKTLKRPQEYIINNGGQIFFALKQDLVIGTAAMVKKKNSYELAKMAVTKKYQGRGIGKMLLKECIDFAKQNKATEIFLVTNDSLKIALNLYQSCGFEFDLNYDDNRYERGNTKMVLNLTNDKK